MPSSYTPSLRLVLPVQGELTGNWGTTVNNGLTSLVDAAIAGTATVSMTDANYTLTAANEAADEARQMFIRLTGTLSTTRNVICPAVSKLYFVSNETTGGQSIVFKTAAGTGITVPNGSRVSLCCDGTNVVVAANRFEGNVTGDVSGNAGTVTNGVYTTGNQTIGGVKTFSSTPVVPDASFALAKIQNIATDRILGRASSGSGVAEELSAIPSAVTVPAGSIAGALNASGSAPLYACRAWVNFNGTTSPGTIRASGNVSSVTKNGTGDYTVNFTTAMSDANYSTSLYSDGSSGSGQMHRISQTASALRVGTGDRLYETIQDGVNNSVSIFR
jgi:hypothetical protein